MTADEVRALLDLKRHPTYGYVRVTYVSPMPIPAGALPAPFETGRPLGSALIFQVTPDAHVSLHRIRNDQFYHYYLGDPVEVIMLKTDGSVDRAICGPDIKSGHALQLFIPGDTFHTARVAGARQWFLGASTEWPGVEPADVEPGDLEALCAKYPSAAADLRLFAQA
jgi:predicted cupin superfamily sugar epimerase